MSAGPPTDDLTPARLRRLTWWFVALGVALRVARYVMNYPLWWDEAFVAVNFLRRGYLDLLRPLDYGQVCPVLFLWAELTAVKLFGFSEWSLRLVPLACAVASVFLFRVAAGMVLRGVPLLAGRGDLRGLVPPDPTRRRREALCRRPPRRARPSDRRARLAPPARPPRPALGARGARAAGPGGLAPGRLRRGRDRARPGAGGRAGRIATGRPGICGLPARHRRDVPRPLRRVHLGAVGRHAGDDAGAMGQGVPAAGGTLRPGPLARHRPHRQHVRLPLRRRPRRQRDQPRPLRRRRGRALSARSRGGRGGLPRAVRSRPGRRGLAAIPVWRRGPRLARAGDAIPRARHLPAHGRRRLGLARAAARPAPAAPRPAGSACSRSCWSGSSRWRPTRPTRIVPSTPRRAREFARAFWPAVCRDAGPVCLRWDLRRSAGGTRPTSTSPFTSATSGSIPPRRGEDRPGPGPRRLRCVLSLSDPDDALVFDKLGATVAGYRLHDRRILDVNMADRGSRPRVERYVVYEFVPGPADRALTRTTDATILQE